MKRIHIIKQLGKITTQSPQFQEPEFPPPQPEPEILPQTEPDQPFPPEESPEVIDPDPVPEQAPPEFIPLENNLLRKQEIPRSDLNLSRGDVLKIF